MQIENLILINKSAIHKIAKKHGVVSIKLFGSFAKGTDNEHSDVDFLVKFKKDSTLFDLIALKNDLELLLGRTVDVVTEDALHWSIRKQVLEESIKI